MERLKTIGAKSGNCRICRTFAPLTEDHIPPQSLPRIGRFKLHALTDRLSAGSPKYSPRFFQNGVYYKTICEECNSKRLGNEYDPALVNLCNEIDLSAKSNFFVPKTFLIQLNRLTRSFVGHTLAHGLLELEQTPFLKALGDYFLDPGLTFPSELSAYLWPYPFDSQVVGKGMAQIFDFRYRQEPCVFNLIKFYPIGFLCSTAPLPESQTRGLLRIDPLLNSEIDAKTLISFSLSSHPAINWPEAPGKHGCAFHHTELSTAALKPNA